MKPIKRNKYGKYLWEQVHIDFLKSNWPQKSNREIKNIPLWMFDFLIKNHFDVFGLIEKGLAEPIETSKAKGE